MDDEFFMKLALEEAERASKRGDLPVGAVLTLDNVIIGFGGNLATSHKDWISHAENNLLIKYSDKLKKYKGDNSVLYTTWEPCMMCASTAAMSRVKKIIYSCPDPLGGATLFDVENFPQWYKKHWPKIEKGSYEKVSYDLLTIHMEENPEIWERFLPRFKEKMKGKNREQIIL
ncbi:MAG TPA: nucleoside deaminase [Candidatus Nanoarchaeia archaeon]|nr:nucleoside deaminase [Candidatus Nanoarchaeia archaeon]